jgi:ATP-binding cassette subfamily B protein
LILWGLKDVDTGHDNAYELFGEILAFILYINMLYRPIRQLADRFNVLQMGMVGSERVFEVLDTDAQLVQTDNRNDVPLRGNIRFEDVWLAYKDEDYILKGIDLEVAQGETIAFVGTTGAGKSSIINLLGRFYEFQKGRILLEGVDIRDFDKEHLRKHIAVVQQDVFLFSDSIRNNLSLNQADISDEMIIEAAKAVGAHGFIDKLPGGYDFDVAERGRMLSAGQRQLLAFIRAYVQNPDILILDEATSSVDSESEALIQEAEERLTEGRTSIIIAHRLSTIQKADRIYVLDKGRIVEQGNHEALLAQGGRYKQLYEMQFS